MALKEFFVVSTVAFNDGLTRAFITESVTAEEKPENYVIEEADRKYHTDYFNTAEEAQSHKDKINSNYKKVEEIFMDKIYNEVCGILSHYDSLSYMVDGIYIPFNKSGVKSNLTAYKRNKTKLINLLRKHPKWDEEALAIIFEGDIDGYTAVLSVNPCDFLLMASGQGWYTAHNLNDEDYRGGLFSYMNDGVSMIFYTVHSDIKSKYYDAPKVTRQVFAYQDGILLQSKLYPNSYNEDMRNRYRDIVQKAIADCLDVKHDWEVRKEQHEIDFYVTTHYDAQFFRDYEYKEFFPNISLLRYYERDGIGLEIGFTAYSVDKDWRLGDIRNAIKQLGLNKQEVNELFSA